MIAGGLESEPGVSSGAGSPVVGGKVPALIPGWVAVEVDWLLLFACRLGSRGGSVAPSRVELGILVIFSEMRERSAGLMPVLVGFVVIRLLYLQ